MIGMVAAVVTAVCVVGIWVLCGLIAIDKATADVLEGWKEARQAEHGDQ